MTTPPRVPPLSSLAEVKEWAEASNRAQPSSDQLLARLLDVTREMLGTRIDDAYLSDDPAEMPASLHQAATEIAFRLYDSRRGNQAPNSYGVGGDMMPLPERLVNEYLVAILRPYAASGTAGSRPS